MLHSVRLTSRVCFGDAVRVASLVSLLALFAPLPSQAQEAKPGEAKEEKITYDQHILPILREKCGTCHNPNDKNGDLALDNYQAALAGGASGEVIKIDGDAENSPLYRVVAHLSEPFMPPEQPKLPDAQIALIKKWIEQGALENAGSPARPKKANVARVEVSTERPAGPPPMPENLPIDPLLVSSRANGVTALAANPWSSLAAVSGHKQVLLYNTETLELVGVLPFPEGQPHVMKFSRNGALLLVGGGRGAHSGKVVLFDVKTGEREAEIGDEYDVVLAADLSADQTLVALGGPKKVVRCYDVATGKQLYELKKHTDWITTLEFSPDGVLLATGDRSNGVIVWEAASGNEFYTLNGHSGSISDLSWAPDSNTLASASEDGTIRLWEMQNGTQVKNFNAHGGGTLGMDFSRDARIPSAGRDRRGKLWDAAGNALKTFEPALPDLGTVAAVCAETDRVLIGDLTGVVHVFSAKEGTKLGELTTNPPALATRIQTAQQQLEAQEKAAAQATAQLAALQKGIADRKAAAETANQAFQAATKAVETTTAAKTAADTDLTAKRQAETQADTARKTAEQAQQQAQAAVDADKKLLTDAQATAKAATDAVPPAEAAVKKAEEALQADAENAELKQAVEAAQTALAQARSASEAAVKKVDEVSKQVAAKTEALTAAVKAVEAAKTAHQQSVTARTAAEKAQADANAEVQKATAAAALRKTEAEKATAAAQVTPEQQKQLADADAAAKAAETELVNTKARLSRLQAAVNLSPKTAAN